MLEERKAKVDKLMKELKENNIFVGFDYWDKVDFNDTDIELDGEPPTNEREVFFYADSVHRGYGDYSDATVAISYPYDYNLIRKMYKKANDISSNLFVTFVLENLVHRMEREAQMKFANIRVENDIPEKIKGFIQKKKDEASLSQSECDYIYTTTEDLVSEYLNDMREFVDSTEVLTVSIFLYPYNNSSYRRNFYVSSEKVEEILNGFLSYLSLPNHTYQQTTYRGNN